MYKFFPYLYKIKIKPSSLKIKSQHCSLLFNSYLLNNPSLTAYNLTTTMNDPNQFHRNNNNNNNNNYSKRRKFEHREENYGRGRGNGRGNVNWSALKRCKSIQSTSYNFSSTLDVSRKWTYSSRDFSGSEERLVVVSYNILAVDNAQKHRYLYPKVSPKHMDWNHRKAVISKELAQYNPSILCFQEVDRFNDLQCVLHPDGYEGVLKPRTGDACDGCAIFWKKERFALLHEEHIEFQSFDLRHNVAQFCVLKTADTCRKLVIGNIHVLFNPKRGDIKLGQIRLFLEKAYKLSQEWGSIPVVLAGDLNSYPQSAVYQYLSSGKLEKLQPEPRYISGQIIKPRFSTFHSLKKESHGQTPLVNGWNNEELKNATGNEGVACLQHNLKLRSAYLGVPGNSMTRDDVGEPSATTCHAECTATVDYIWHTEELVPFRVLETLPRSMLGNITRLPSEKWGSDHLALVCDFAFVDNDSTDEQLQPTHCEQLQLQNLT